MKPEPQDKSKKMYEHCIKKEQNVNWQNAGNKWK